MPLLLFLKHSITTPAKSETFDFAVATKKDLPKSQGLRRSDRWGSVAHTDLETICLWKNELRDWRAFLDPR